LRFPVTPGIFRQKGGAGRRRETPGSQREALPGVWSFANLDGLRARVASVQSASSQTVKKFITGSAGTRAGK
jgi:hypothetical protein